MKYGLVLSLSAGPLCPLQVLGRAEALCLSLDVCEKHRGCCYQERDILMKLEAPHSSPEI